MPNIMKKDDENTEFMRKTNEKKKELEKRYCEICKEKFGDKLVFKGKKDIQRIFSSIKEKS